MSTRRRRARALCATVALLSIVAPACGAFGSGEEDSSPADPASTTGEADGSAAKADAETAAPCTPGAEIYPLFGDQEDLGGGVTCGASHLGGDAGQGSVEMAPGSGAPLGGVRVSGCVRADFGAPYALARLRIRALTQQTACGYACATDCDRATVHVMLGSALGDYRALASRQVSANFSDVGGDVSLLPPARFVVVCRDEGATAAVALATLSATCR